MLYDKNLNFHLKEKRREETKTCGKENHGSKKQVFLNIFYIGSTEPWEVGELIFELVDHSAGMILCTRWKVSAGFLPLYSAHLDNSNFSNWPSDTHQDGLRLVFRVNGLKTSTWGGIWTHKVFGLRPFTQIHSNSRLKAGTPEILR